MTKKRKHFMTDKDRESNIRKTATTAWISGVFTLVIALLLIINYIHLQQSDPLERGATEALLDRLGDEPGNEKLMQEIRHLDLLSRKAWFNSLWRLRTGAILLLAGAIVLVTALRRHHALRFAIAPPQPEEADQATVRRRSRYWVIGAAALIIIPALLAAWLSTDYLAISHERLSATDDVTDNGITRVEITTPGETDIADADTLPDQDTTTALAEAPFTEATVRANHNAFRGAWGNGHSAATGLPTRWNGATGQNILWKTEIPIHGYNSPIIWDDKIFLSGANPEKRVVYCLDRQTGKILWERAVDNIPGSPARAPRTTDDTGLAAPTLTTDGTRVFALFGTGDIIAFDFEGNRLWARNLGVPSNHYGHSSSLLTWQDKVFVQYDTQGPCRVLALDTRTGRTVWETPRSNGISWSSPLLAKINNTFRLFLQANPTLSAYDISNGRQLWSVNCMSGEVGPSPASGGGKIYAANEYARMVATDPATGEILWEDNYYLPEVSSPVYHNGLLYIATTFAVIACFDAETGEFLWEYDTDSELYSSPMIADGKLFVFDTKGKAYIFNPGRTARLISSPKLGETVHATPAFSNGRIYVRGKKHLYCIESS